MSTFETLTPKKLLEMNLKLNKALKNMNADNSWINSIEREECQAMF